MVPLNTRPAAGLTLVLAAAVFLWGAPIGAQPLPPEVSAPTASADQQPAPGAPPAGPVVERVENSVVFAPEVKITEMNHRTGTLLGGTAGVLMEGHLLVGGAGYWLVNTGHDYELGYIGVVTGWYLRGQGAFDASVSGLVGGGWGTVSATFGGHGPTPMEGRHGEIYPPLPSTPQRYLVSANLFIAEPMVNVVWRMGGGVALTVSGGYRFVSGAGEFNRDFQGATGTVGVRFGAK